MLLIDTIHEVVQKIKHYKNTLIETSFRIKYAFKENNKQTYDFLLFLLLDQNTPVSVKSHILHLLNKLIHELDFTLERSLQIHPIALALLESD